MQQLPKVPEAMFAELFTSLYESAFAAFLTECQNEYPNLEIGSYPTYDRSEYAARVTLKSTDGDVVKDVFNRIRSYFENADALVRANEPSQAKYF